MLADLQALKPVLTALALPPVPLLLLVLIGAWRLARQRRGGMVLVALGVVLMWLSTCEVGALALGKLLMPPLPPLAETQIAALGGSRAGGDHATAIVVLGAGRERWAPESGGADLRPRSIERLRYGVRLARETGLPLAFSGGLGWAQRDEGGASEAEIARRVAERDFRWPLAWIEPDSRDTHENAVFTVRLLRAAGIRRIVLVTHVWHMPRAMLEFERAAGGGLSVVAAPMGYAQFSGRSLLAWLPSMDGTEQVRLLLREALARAAET